MPLGLTRHQQEGRVAHSWSPQIWVPHPYAVSSRMGGLSREARSQPLNSPHATRAHQTPTGRPSSLHHFQLLPSSLILERRPLTNYLRTHPRNPPQTAPLPRTRVRTNARARSSALIRTRKPSPQNNPQRSQRRNLEATERRPQTVLASPLLRLQRLYRSQAHREAQVHAPKPGHQRTRHKTRRLALEQLPPPRNRRAGKGRGRITLDRPETRRAYDG